MEKIDLKEDIYYTKEYASTYLGKNDKFFEFEYREKDKYFKNIAIKSSILEIAGVEIKDGYFDLQTPYGYGGYLTNSDDPVFIKTALGRYKEFCIKNKIIAEFLRFHPFNTFPGEYSNFLDFCVQDRKTVYVDLRMEYSKIWKSYDSSLKGGIKKANNLGLKCKLLPSICESNFIEQYYKTMLKKNASRFYFFSKSYFESLEKMKNVKLYCATHEDKQLNYIVILESYPFIYYHLGATDSNYNRFNPNAFILNKLIELYKAKDFKIFFMGGGKSSSENDTLYKFKKNFSPLTKQYYIGGKIFMPQVYQEYITLWEKETKGREYPPHFLRYRLECQN